MREYGMVNSVRQSVYVYPSAGKRRKQRARKRKGRSQGARPLLSLTKEARNAVLNCHRRVNLRESKPPDTLGVCREQAGMLQGQLKSELSVNSKPPAWKHRREPSTPGCLPMWEISLRYTSSLLGSADPRPHPIHTTSVTLCQQVPCLRHRNGRETGERMGDPLHPHSTPAKGT